MTQMTLEDLVIKGPLRGTIEKVPVEWIHVGTSLPASPTMIESVKLHGILSPPLLNRKPAGGFDVIAGKRRVLSARACEIATIDALVYEVPEYAVALLTVPIIENIIRSDNMAQQAEYLDALFERGADEELLSGALAMGKRKVINRRKIWTNLHSGLRDPYSTGKINTAVATAVGRLGGVLQDQCYALFADTGALTMRDIARIKGDGEATELPGLEDANTVGWRAKARTAAFDLEMAVRVGAQENTDAAELLGRLVSIFEEYGLRSIAFGSDERAKADSVLSAEEQEFFGGVPGVRNLSRDWRYAVMNGDVDKALTGAIAVLGRSWQDLLYHKWCNDGYLHDNFDAAAVRKFVDEQSVIEGRNELSESEGDDSGDDASTVIDEPDRSSEGKSGAQGASECLTYEGVLFGGEVPDDGACSGCDGEWVQGDHYTREYIAMATSGNPDSYHPDPEPENVTPIRKSRKKVKSGTVGTDTAAEG